MKTLIFCAGFFGMFTLFFLGVIGVFTMGAFLLGAGLVIATK